VGVINEAKVLTESSGNGERRRRGRPRDPSLDRAILDASFELLVETGVRGFSVREVARRAHIPKSSIYRRWKTRAALLGSALEQFGLESRTQPDTGRLESDLVEVVRDQMLGIAATRGPLARIALEVRDDPELAPVVRNVLAKRRSALYPVFERAVARGDLAANVNIDEAIDLLVGPIWIRIMMQRPVTEADAPAIVSRALKGMALASTG
jgi:AcrR family transcriptional regulator